MNPMHAIILAAGISSRFGIEFNKLLTPLCGVPLILHVVRALEPIKIPITVVVGYQRDQMIATIEKHSVGPISFALQEKPCGTGHAVMCSRSQWQASTLLILNGDMPLITTEIIDNLYTKHLASGATVSFVTALPNTANHAYGRVIEDSEGIRIIEAKDFTGDPSINHLINAGIYLFERDFLETSIDSLTTNNAVKELYITDLIAIANKKGKTIRTLQVPFDAVRGVNTIAEFAAAQVVERQKIINYWMHNGVLFMNPESVHIDNEVIIGRGTIIQAGVQLRGKTIIGSCCTIDAYVILEDAHLADHVVVHSHSVIKKSELDSYADVGPFAYLHTQKDLAQPILVGNSQQSSFALKGDTI